MDQQKIEKAFDELTFATGVLFKSLRKAGFSRKESFLIARDWFLVCIHSSNQQSAIVDTLLQNIQVPKVS